MFRKSMLAAAALFFITNMAVAGERGNDLKQGLVFTGLAAVGAVLGGPVGLVAGAATGGWLADNVGKAGENKQLTAELQSSRHREEALASQLDAASKRSDRLAGELATARAVTDRYEQLAADYLSFQVMFHTGEATLDTDSSQRLAALADFIAGQPDIRISLAGQADPRGGDEYNEQLSRQRTESVIAMLENAGISRDRITADVLGESQSTAPEGDLDAYALERRVTIDLALPPADTGLASTAAR